MSSGTTRPRAARAAATRRLIQVHQIPSEIQDFARLTPSRKVFYAFSREFIRNNNENGSYGPGIHIHWAERLGLRKVRTRKTKLDTIEINNNTLQVTADNGSLVSAVQYGFSTPQIHHPPPSISDITMRSASAVPASTMSTTLKDNRPSGSTNEIVGKATIPPNPVHECSSYNESARIDALEKQLKILSQMFSVASFQLDSLYPMMAESIFNREKRQWFISNYKNEINEADDEDRRILTAASSSHETFKLTPNAIADAILYKEKRRFDVSHFKRLYGIDPLRVLCITDNVTISILNKHASIAGTEHRHRLSPVFHSFIQLLENANYPENFMYHLTTAHTPPDQQQQQLISQQQQQLTTVAYAALAFIQEFRETFDVMRC